MFNATDQEYLPRSSGGSGTSSAAGITSTVTDQAISSGGLSKKIQFNATEFDIGGDYDTANYQYTAPSAGQYKLKLQVQWLNPSDTTEMVVNIANGDNSTRYAASRLNGSTHTNPTHQVSRTVSLSSGDTVAFYCEHDEGSDLNINTDNSPLTFAEVTKIA